MRTLIDSDSSLISPVDLMDIFFRRCEVVRLEDASTPSGEPAPSDCHPRMQFGCEHHWTEILFPMSKRILRRIRINERLLIARGEPEDNDGDH